MSGFTIDSNNNISIHGRASLAIAVVLTHEQDGEKTQLDLSNYVVWFEIDGIKGPSFRKRLFHNPYDPHSLVITLSRSEVERLEPRPKNFTVLDETDPDNPDLFWEGKIARRGYGFAPDDRDES